MGPIRILAAAVAFAGLVASSALASGFDQRLFDTFVAARAGTGKPVYWYSTGTLRAYPSGELIATMEGFDTGRSVRPDPSKPLVQQFSRKIYIFRDPKTGEVLTRFNGGKGAPIAYPYQFITYELKGDQVETWVEQGRGARVQRIGPGDTMQARWMGDTAVFTAPLFLDVPIGQTGRRYQAWENYDFFIQTRRGVRQPHQLSWARYGDAPAFAGGVPSIMHLVTWRVDRFEDLPASIRDYVNADAPLWREPPKDLADIRRLQKDEGTP